MSRVALLLIASSVSAGYAASAAAVDTSSDRITFQAAGSTLSHTHGGGRGELGWIHNFSESTLVGVAGTYQSLGGARWGFGSLTLSQGWGATEHRSTAYAEAHVGSGKDNVHSYDYQIYAAGLYQSLTRQLSLQLEDRQVDVDTVRGNLPKVGMQYLWTPTFATSANYTYSVSGDLGTRLVGVRLDKFGKTVSFLAGAANGQASPVVIDLQSNIRVPAATLHEYYAGVTRNFSRAELSLVADYQKLSESERVSLTLNCTFHVRKPGEAR